VPHCSENLAEQKNCSQKAVGQKNRSRKALKQKNRAASWIAKSKRKLGHRFACVEIVGNSNLIAYLLVSQAPFLPNLLLNSVEDSVRFL
jgi:hypothetical protein